MNTHQLIKLHEKAAHLLEMIQENQRRIKSVKNDLGNSILMLTEYKWHIHKSIADKKAVGDRLEKRYASLLNEITNIFLFT